MNWTVIIGITEIVGVLALIASMIYVAKQIRQNSSIACANIVHGTSDTWMNFHSMLATNATLADLYRRGSLGESLTETEVVQFQSLIEAYVAILEDMDHQLKMDLYFNEDDGVDIIEFLSPSFRPLLGSPIGKDWWRRIAPHTLPPSVYKKIEKIMWDWDQEEFA